MDLFEKKRKKEKIKQILKDKGINIAIEGCGCCGSSCVSFEYNGEMIIIDEQYFNIDTFEND